MGMLVMFRRGKRGSQQPASVSSKTSGQEKALRTRCSSASSRSCQSTRPLRKAETGAMGGATGADTAPSLPVLTKTLLN